MLRVNSIPIDPAEHQFIVVNPYYLNLPSLFVTSGIFMDAGLFQGLDVFLYEQNPRVRKCNGLLLEIIFTWNLKLVKQLGLHSSLYEETGLLYR